MGLISTGRLSSAVLLFGFGSLLSAAPRLQLSTAAIGPVYVATGATSAQTVEAYNAGDGSLNLTVSSTASWLAGTVGAQRPCSFRGGNCLPVAIALNTASLQPGTYTEFLTLTDPNAVDSPQQISVTISVAGVPSNITLYAAPGGTAQQNVYPTAQVAGAVTTQSGGNFLQFTLSGGGSFAFGTPYSVQATAGSAMAPGIYNGAVALTGSSNAADNKKVNVAFNVTTAPIIQMNNSTVRLKTFQGGARQTANVAFNNLGQGSLAITGATASSGTGNFLSAAVVNGNTVSITADPGSLTPGIYNGSVTLASNAANNGDVSIPVSFTVTQANQPFITQGGVVNIATYIQSEAVAQGGIAAVFGDQLAPAGTVLQNTGKPPLATSLGNVQVLVNGAPAPLYFVSPGQINFQVPYETPAAQPATVQISTNGTVSNTRTLMVISGIPRIMAWPDAVARGGYGIVVNQDGSLVLPSSNAVAGFTVHSAKPGDTITIYCLGLGQTSPAAATGAGATASPLLTIPNVTVTFGGGFLGRPTTATAAFAGLTPTAVGLYQVNVAVPADAPLGTTIPLTLNVNGIISNFVYLPITQSGS